MKTARFVILIACVSLGTAAFSAEHYVHTNIGVCETFNCTEPGAGVAWDSGAWVESRFLGFPYQIGMRNNHNVYEDNAQLVGWRRGEGFWSDWQSYLYGGPREGHCYNAHLDSVAGSSVKDIPSANPWRWCWGGSGAGCGCDLQDDGGNCPLILNLGRGAWSLTGTEDPVSFDIDADGQAETIGWTGRDTSLAFLAIDLDQDGAIGDGRELFGVGTGLPDGSTATNGFAALRQHDANGDDVLDEHDAVWSFLLLWTDRNHDGRSQPGELAPVAQSNVTVLELGPREVGKRDKHGNTFRLKSHYRIDGARQPYYDVFFVDAN